MKDKIKKVLLVNCPPWGTVMPPLGIAYISSYLKSKDIAVDILDLNLELYEAAGCCCWRYNRFLGE